MMIKLMMSTLLILNLTTQLSYGAQAGGAKWALRLLEQNRHKQDLLNVVKSNKATAITKLLKSPPNPPAPEKHGRTIPVHLITKRRLTTAIGLLLLAAEADDLEKKATAKRTFFVAAKASDLLKGIDPNTYVQHNKRLGTTRK